MKVLTNEQCEIVGGGRAVSDVLASAAVGASKTAAGIFTALSAYEYTATWQIVKMPFMTLYSTEQIVQSSLIAGGIYFAGYIGASAYLALKPE